MVDIAGQIAAQHVLLSDTSGRNEIVGLSLQGYRFGGRTLRVHRNHNFEMIEPILSIYGAYIGFEIKTVVGSYDDSVSFQNLDEEKADIELLWLDYSRYDLEPVMLAEFIASRVVALRHLTTSPILICDHPQASDFNRTLEEKIGTLPGSYILPLSELARKVGAGFYDHARATHFGTSFNTRVLPKIARLLSLYYLPALLRSRIKAIAIDLDNTLYRGVLGEDGPQGILLTEGHRRLQAALVKLGSSGVLLTLTSKNVEQDVEVLFAERADFPLRLEHLAGRRINWEGKAANIVSLAADFNISPADFLFLDDNPGEIARVLAEIPLIDVMHASEDASVTMHELGMFPGLFSLANSDTDIKRRKDIVARQQRLSEQQEAQSVEQYLALMDTALGLYMKDGAAFNRLCEIPLKTNQFNLALQRLSAVQVRSYMESADAFVVSMSLKDKLSTSGNVGAIYAKLNGDILVVDEVCVSCRALGRGIEDFMLAKALEQMLKASSNPPSFIRFMHRVGSRNQPALQWLQKFTKKTISTAQAGGADEREPNIGFVDYPVGELYNYLESARAFPVKVHLQTSF